MLLWWWLQYFPFKSAWVELIGMATQQTEVQPLFVHDAFPRPRAAMTTRSSSGWWASNPEIKSHYIASCSVCFGWGYMHRPSIPQVPAQGSQSQRTARQYVQACSRPYAQACSRPYAQACSRPYVQACSRPYAQACSRPYVQACSRPYVQACSRPYVQACSRPYSIILMILFS